MNKMNNFKVSAVYLILISVFSLIHMAGAAPDPLPGWSNAVDFDINTKATGANVKGDVNGIPVLVRLDSTYFDFTGSQDSGQDIRFTMNATTVTLPYQIETWDPQNGRAAIWVLMDVQGNTEEQLVIHWGNATAPVGQNAAAVFATSSGYGAVWHLDSTLTDVTVNGNNGSAFGNTDVTGLIGNGQYFDGLKVLSFGNDSTIFPDDAITVSTWLKTSDTSSATTSILRMNGYYTALQLHRDDDTTMTYPTQAHSVAWTVDGPLQYSIFPWNGVFNDDQWHHFVSEFTVAGGVKIYMDGALYFSNTNVTGAFDTLRGDEGGFSVGGTSGFGETYTGLLDEIRISNVARSADWIKLNYENQKPGQTLISLPIDENCTNNFGVSTTSLEVGEGADYSVLGSPGCAKQFYWAMVNATGEDTPIFTNGLALTGNSGRHDAETIKTFRFYALEGGIWISSDPVVLTFKNDIPDPIFTLTGPTTTWNGLDTLVFRPTVTNLVEILASLAPELNYDWTTYGPYVIRFASGDRLEVVRSFGDGVVIVELCLDNGGTPVCDSVSFDVVVGINDIGLTDKRLIQISAGFIEWNKAALVKIWSVDGRLVFAQSGKAGEKLRLTPQLQRILGRKRHHVEIIPLK